MEQSPSSALLSSNIQRGVVVLEQALRTMPAKPGVYRLQNAAGADLYIGKAKNLAARVPAYTKLNELPIRLQRMVALVAQVEIITTHTEVEALLLEANLIKKQQPPYNVLLKDDKSFPSLYISDHPFPRLSKHRGARQGGGDYFGPFPSRAVADEVMPMLLRAFQLRTCSDNEFASRRRPCLQYHIKRCAAPCVQLIDALSYQARVQQAKAVLRGRSREVQDSLQAAMATASAAQDYETAAQYRDRLRALAKVQAQQGVHLDSHLNADVVAWHSEAGLTAVQILFYRDGAHYGGHCFFPRHTVDASVDEIITSFIGQYYANHEPPAEIILPTALPETPWLEQALSAHYGRGVAVHVPQRGVKKDLVAQAQDNAQTAWSRRRAENSSQAEIFTRLAQVFNLTQPPARIEVYDNSHTFGQQAVAALIAADQDGFIKSGYRRKMVPRDSLAAGDDYAMLRLMVQSCYKTGRTSILPDLMLIDGGLGQLHAVQQVLQELGLTIPVVAIAKGVDRNAGRERFFLSHREPFTLPIDDPLLHYLQRLRDEAHRFAINSHRARRQKAMTESDFSTIPGIGAARKKALLLHFGSLRDVASASVMDLQRVPGISASLAQKIYNHFHAS